ncbi:MAG: phage tail tape measure protein [Culicoidibacterales bacterium]
MELREQKAGTALRNMILSLSAPTDKASLMMDSLGLSVFDADGNMRPMNETMQDLDGILSTMTQGEQTEVLNTIFNKVDLKSVNALLANSGERFDELSGHIANADGSAANMAETMQNNLKGKMEIIGSSMEGLGIQVYEKLEGPLKQAAETAIEAMGNLSDDLSNGALGESVDNLAEGFGNMITAISEGAEKWLPKIIDGLTWVMDNSGTIASLIGAIVVGLTAMNVANMIHGVAKAFQAYKAKTEGATVAQWLLNVAMSANPVGIVIALILALVAGIVILWNTNEDFRNALIGAWEAIKACGVAVWDWLVKVFTETIPNAFNAVVDFFANNWQTILGFIINPLGTAFSWCYENLEGFRTFIDTIVENVKTFIMNGFNAIGNFFTETIPQWIENIGTWFSELPYKIGFAIGQALGSIIQWGADCRDYLETNVPLWINSVVTFFSELPGKIWDWLVNAYNRVVQWGSDMWKKVTEIATEFVNRIITGISRMPSFIWDKLTTAYNNVVTWGSNMWTKATEVGSTFVNNIINFIKELPSKVWNWFTQTISKVISFGSDAGTKAREAGGKIVDNVINAVKNLPSQIFDIGKNIVQGLWNGITSMGSWISDKVSGFFSGIVDGAKSVLGIHSPSRVFRDQVGKYMAEGVGVGFEDEAKHVQLDMNKSLSALTADMSATVQADMNMFGARNAGTTGGTTSNHAPVSEKLEKLIAMFDRFINNTIPSYQVVMDTGVLVGQLAPGINRELAIESGYRERGR